MAKKMLVILLILGIISTVGLTAEVGYAKVSPDLRFEIYSPAGSVYKVNDYIPLWFDVYLWRCNECAYFGVFVSTDNKATWRELINNMRFPLNQPTCDFVVGQKEILRCKYNIPTSPDTFVRDTNKVFIKVVLYDQNEQPITSNITDNPISVKHMKILRPDSKTVFKKGKREIITWIGYKPTLDKIKSIKISFGNSPTGPWKLITVLPPSETYYIWVPDVAPTQSGYIKVEMLDIYRRTITSDINSEPFEVVE